MKVDYSYTVAVNNWIIEIDRTTAHEIEASGYAVVNEHTYEVLAIHRTSRGVQFEV